MGKWSDFTSIEITPDKFDKAIAEILKEFGDVVYKATEEGLDAAEDILIKNLKAATPGSPPHKRNFAKNWKGKGRKYTLRRYVGNSTVVKGKSGDIALANIFEYSTTRGKPFIKETFENSIEPMAQAVVNEIKRGV